MHEERGRLMWIKGEGTEKNSRGGTGDSCKAQEYPVLRLFSLLFFFLCF